MAQSIELSTREEEVVKLLLEGKSNKLIASALHISERTVEFHLKNIYAKHQVSSRMELVLKLGKTADRREATKLGESTVANEGEVAENRDRLNLSKNWANLLRETVSIIGKELKVDAVLNSKDRNAPMTFFEAIRVCFVKYADFNGRASRAEYWWFMLFITLVASALAYLSESAVSIFLIAVLLPFLAVGSRRLRDTGRSGWWQLYMLVPVAGIFLVWIYCAEPSKSLPDDSMPQG
jgi:DNA-binding CsgD family transcriptional regulator